MIRALIISSALLVSFGPASALDQNFQGRRAIIVNSSPFIELSGFDFVNKQIDRSQRFQQKLYWKNIGQQPVIATEIIILKYDAFDQRLIGTRFVVEGRNSADWSPLLPGEENTDATIGYRTESVLTAIAYVRAVRLADGTIWRVNESELLPKLRQAVPGLKDFGRLNADPNPKPE